VSRVLAGALKRLMPDLRAFARSVAANPCDSDDIVQDAVERALKSGGAPDDDEALRRWMFRVIRNLNIDELRKLRVRREYSVTQMRLHDDAPHHADVASNVLVRIAFDALQPATREVLFLVDVAGLRYAEAAEVMEVPEGTVMSRLSRARKVMRDRIEERPDGQVRKTTR